METTKRESEFAKSLIEVSLDPLVTTDITGKIIKTNQAMSDITGLSCEKLLDTCLTDYFVEPQSVRVIYEEALKNGLVTNLPLLLRSKKGKLFEVILRAVVFKDENEKNSGFVIVIKDLTTYKLLIKREMEGREKELMRIEELEKFKKLSVGRELKMIELKNEIKELKNKIQIN